MTTTTRTKELSSAYRERFAQVCDSVPGVDRDTLWPLLADAEYVPRYCPPFVPMAAVIPAGQDGEWEVEHYQMDREEVSFHQTVGAMRRRQWDTYDLVPGRYCRLARSRLGETVMTDTPMERRTNAEFVAQATGDVLIAGLGLGMVIPPLLAKQDVGHVTVVERSAEVIRLVEPHLRAAIGRRAENGFHVEHADIFEWRPPRGKPWRTIYFDIWSGISTDNLEQMATLHRKFAQKLDRSRTHWMGSWRHHELRLEVRRDRSRW